MPPASLPRLEYAREPDVSTALDGELRALLTVCFPQPHNTFFRERRYAHEVPLHRYLLRDEGGQLLAHLAVHQKRISVGQSELAVGGIAEVAVQPSERGKGHVKRLLEVAHGGLREAGIHFALLFGEAPIYGSSGYRLITAPIRRFNPTTQTFDEGTSHLALYKPLTDSPWPEGLVDLRGPMF